MNRIDVPVDPKLSHLFFGRDSGSILRIILLTALAGISISFMRTVFLYSLACAIFLPSFALGANASEEDAINHLLNFVERSQCTFIRNGIEYDSRDAVGHIKRKYSYFKGKVYTPEDFIALAATKSEVTGRPYFVQCGEGDRIPSALWLRVELEAYRKTRQKDK